MRKPKWWDKPITWGASVTMSLLSIPITFVLMVILDALNGGDVYIEPLCEKWEDAKDWISDLFDK